MLIKELIAQIRFEVDEASYQGAARSLGVIKGLIKLVEQGARINFDVSGVNKAAAALTNLSRARLGVGPYGAERETQRQDDGASVSIPSLRPMRKVEVDTEPIKKAEADLKRLERPIRLRLRNGDIVTRMVRPLRAATSGTHVIGFRVSDGGSTDRAIRKLKALHKVKKLLEGGQTAVFKSDDGKGLGQTFADWNQSLMLTPGLLSLIKNRLGYLMAFAGVSFSVQRYIAMSDQWKTIEGQIKNVIKDESRLVEIEDKLYASAARTRQSYAETAGLFTSVTRNASELGKSTDEVLAFAEDVSNALLLGGGGKASQQAALVQLGQALGSGVLRGDELNSIMEQAPKLAQTIAQGMGIGIGQLRQYGREGKITAQQVFDAVRGQSDELKKGVSNIPWTVQQAMGRVSDALGRFFFIIEKEFGLASKVSRVISGIADIFDALTTNSERFAVALKLAAMYAGLYATVIFASAKRTVIIAALQTIISLLGITSVGFTGAAAAAGVFQAAAIRAGLASAGAWALSAAPVLLVIAALVALYVILEDIYYWFTGEKKSLLGEVFGTWEQAMDKMVAHFKLALREIKRALNNFTEKFMGVKLFEDIDGDLPKTGMYFRSRGPNAEHTRRSVTRDATTLTRNLGGIFFNSSDTVTIVVKDDKTGNAIRQELGEWKSRHLRNSVEKIQDAVLIAEASD